MKSKIYLDGVWMEDVFTWFSNHISFSCGDGAGAIVCENYEQAAEWFLEWVKQEDKGKFPHFEKHIFALTRDQNVVPGIINFHNWNENWIFTNKKDFELHAGDYVFIVKTPCRTMLYGDRALMPIK